MGHEFFAVFLKFVKEIKNVTSVEIWQNSCNTHDGLLHVNAACNVFKLHIEALRDEQNIHDTLRKIALFNI